MLAGSVGSRMQHFHIMEYRTKWCSFISAVLLMILFTLSPVYANLWAELERIRDLSEFRYLCSRYTVAQAYMEDSNAKISVFAPVDEVFAYNPNLKALDQKQLLSHIDVQVPELARGGKWDKQTLIRTSVNSGNVYITQFENNPKNYSYFANNGQLCNHVSSSWAVTSGEQYLYKICTPMGFRSFPNTALNFVRMTDDTYFHDRNYDNSQLTELRDILERVPDVAMVIYGSSAWNGYHTFFLPTNKAFAKVADRSRMNREVLLAHVTGKNRVYFTHSWLFDGGIHYYPSIRFASNVIEDNFRLKLAIRNVTDRRTGRWDVYAVSEVYERYSNFKRGSVWAKIVTPNIPVQNGVVHIVDSVLGIVSNTIDQLLNENPKCTSLMHYINTIGQIVRSYFSATGGQITFFAPVNEAFDRIPEAVEKRLLRDRLWLEQILKLHIVPANDLTSDQISNDTIVNTVDQRRQLYFVRGEWPKNNISKRLFLNYVTQFEKCEAYYVIGGGVKAAILQDNVAATNGIIHYINRVLGVPYRTMYNIIRNETTLQATFYNLEQSQLRFALDPWEVVRPEQNFTFFVPTNEAWEKVPAWLRQRFLDGDHWRALSFVYKRHIIQGQALMYTDLRERTYVMMNNQKVVLRRTGRFFNLYWPYGNRVARVQEGGEIAAINGFMHKIDNVLVLDEDLTAGEISSGADLMLILLCAFLLVPKILFGR